MRTAAVSHTEKCRERERLIHRNSSFLLVIFESEGSCFTISTYQDNGN